MQKLLIIRGYSCSGKTTISRQLAKECRFALIEYDFFHFRLIRYKNYKTTEHKIIFKTVLDCMRNCMKYKKNIILEGALAPIDRGDPFQIEKITNLAKRHNYKIINVLFVVDKKIARKRMKIRNNFLSNKLYDKLVNKIKSIKIKDEIVIDTTKLSIRSVITKLKKLL